MARRSRSGRGDLSDARRLADDAVAITADVEAHLPTPAVLECLARVSVGTGSHCEAARIFDAAEALWH